MKVLLVLLCWAAMSTPFSLEAAEKDKTHYFLGAVSNKALSQTSDWFTDSRKDSTNLLIRPSDNS
ncbi:MAG: hypothetical protein H6617_07220 [Bdellovibrionaceae bacterium]|nr:hypothetical protein [Bdellovibrionales bacterium]MCB9254458.1 hypothetical protein [Pseudobdellovibrionaceae bacterium]